MKLKQIRIKGGIVYVHLWGVMRSDYEYPLIYRTRREARKWVDSFLHTGPATEKRCVVKVLISWRNEKGEKA